MQQLKPLIDLGSLAIVVSTIAAWLPAIAALVSIIWGLIRIYETKTVQGWLGKNKSPARSVDENT